MNHLTEAEVGMYILYNNRVTKLAEEIRVRYVELYKEYDQGDRSCQFVSFRGIEDGNLAYQGYETWNFGGFEERYFQLPLNYLTDENWDSDLARNFVHQKRLYEIKKGKEALAEAEKAKAKKKADYERLKKEFGDQ